MGVNGRGKREKQLAAMRPRGTPVPIPNTTVKTRTAEDTALETAWESRWPPALKIFAETQEKKGSARDPSVCKTGVRLAGRHSQRAEGRKSDRTPAYLENFIQRR